MEMLIIFYLFLFGVIIGSFLNVYLIRFNTGKSVLGRSACMSCKTKLSWKELFPILSYIYQKGRCRKCLSKISIQYPLVEIIIGILSLFAYFVSYGNVIDYIFLFFVFSVLFAIALYDLWHFIIPDKLLFLLIVSFIIYAFLMVDLNIFILQLLSGIALFLPFYFIWLFSQGKLMGLGDGKLAFVVGLIFGFKIAGLGIITGIFLGAFIGVILLILSYTQDYFAFTIKNYTIKSELPFAPFMIAGVFIQLLLSMF